MRQRRAESLRVIVDKWGALAALTGGAGGGAEVRAREGISVCTELDGRALPDSPRYQ